MVAILVLLTIITFLTVDYFAQRAALRRAAESPATAATGRLEVRAPADIASLPAGVFVGPGHTWLELRPAGEVHLGADRVPVTLLGGLDALETVPEGTEIQRGERIALLRKGERSVEVRSPVDGVVTATNAAVTAEPRRLVREPFAAGWLVRVSPQGLAGALKRLFVAEEAGSWMRKELARLRDFVVGMGSRGALAAATLPDGGLPVDGLAEHLSDEEWSQLTERFFAQPAPPES